MWVEELDNGKFKYFERYTEPYSEKVKRVSVTLESDSGRAKNKAVKILADRIDEKLKNYNRSDMRFDELYKEWFIYYKMHVKRTSWTKVPKMMKHINKVIPGDTLIRNIDEELIQKIVEEMYTFGTLSLNYTKQTKTTLSVMLNYAQQKKYISNNPALLVKIQPKKSEEEKRRKQMDEKYLDQKEVKVILDHVRKRNSRSLHAYIAEFLYLTGLRYGELQALQIKNYDGESIRVNGTLDYSFLKMAEAVKTAPKNVYSNRIVELSDRAKEILNQVIADNTFRQGEQAPDNYIFTSNRGTPLSLHSFNAILHKVEEELSFEKKLSSHIFRHSHVSLLSELNVPLKAIMERVGHSDANTTLSIYNHVTKKAKKQVINKLNSL
ncbi:tyrosine-type recombinase/integrase [Enterococcus termitis]|uniref:Integrase n=1 Tax=Enterococcus termitis TaxID=332950 RepID=A0A1E5GII8_9ENTE|nr:site-specific integrase [Enterococcus termitis]OEG12497.1 integrase [Enterococcus termitis]OJG96712.1 integrase [Enterococcus termitis]